MSHTPYDVYVSHTHYDVYVRKQCLSVDEIMNMLLENLAKNVRFLFS
jgi:hypothetical protein